jgi:hypothetical protein
LSVSVRKDILATGNWRREEDPSSINGLEDALHVAPPSDFLDEDGCETFRSQFLVNAEEIDFRTRFATKKMELIMDDFCSHERSGLRH